ncbi:MAG: peptide chain release factor N(5)-glutamine methyltransferase [Clostridiales bacterium]|nr:peptide chain release factor N(5)-glutamine methyltransferase [Clostridiales bacterium]
MAKIDYSKIFIKEACPTSIGGQAIMEGVMMQGPDRTAIAMRLPSGELYLKTKKKGKEPKAAKIPFARGIVSFVHALVSGMGTLMESADILEKYAPEEYSEEPGRLEKWINKKFGQKAAWNFLMTSALLFAFVISIVFFIILPTWVVNFLGKWIQSAVVLNLIEGLLRIAIFIGYVVAIRRMDDMMTIFRYHGAEHKTIHCYENDRVLCPENAEEFYTLHPRCGTSFLVFVLIVSLLLFSFLGWPNLALRIISRILLIPVIASISFELLRWAGRSNGKIVRVLSWPGLQLQRLTTAEPTRDQLEVAILSLKAVLVDPATPEITGFVDKDGNIVRSKAEEEIAAREMEAWAADVEAHTEANKEAARRALEETRIEEARTVFEDPGNGADEKDISEAIRFLEDLDSDGYTIVAPEETDGRTLVAAIADREAAQAKARTLARRYTKDIKTYENALSWGQAALGLIENGKNEARMIMSYATGLGTAELITRAKELMREDDFNEFEKRIYARIEGKPLQYIVGMQEFMGLPFRVNPSVLIPRLDTEVLAEEVLKIIDNKGLKNPEVLDLCTGSGALGITIAAKVPGALVTMTDVSEEALHTAMGNAGLNRVNRRCSFLLGDMFEAIPEDKQFDIIVCNPPYIKSDVIETLDVEVKDHEPRIALDGGKDGLDFYRVLADEASMHLRSRGILALEIGCDQAVEVKRLLNKAKTYSDTRVVRDLAQLDRVIIATRK